MQEGQVARLLRHNFDIRVEDEMERYVLRRLGEYRAKKSSGQNADRATSFAVMGGDARTGVPIRIMVDAARLANAIDSAGYPVVNTHPE